LCYRSNGTPTTRTDIQVVEGEDVCVDILVENFTGITAFEFPVFWDSNVLEFIEVMSDFPGINSTIINDGEILKSGFIINML